MVISLYAAIGAVFLSLLLFAPLLVLGAYLVRALKLTQDMPTDLHFAPPAPAIHAPLDKDQTMAIATRQARLAVIHGRARQCVEVVGGLAEYQGLISAAPAQSQLHGLIERATQAATAADVARVSPDIDQADAETARCLAEATAAWDESQTLRDTVPSQRGSSVLIVVLATILAAAVVAVIILHGTTPRP